MYEERKEYMTDIRMNKKDENNQAQFIGRIVRSTMGRDKKRPYVIVGVCTKEADRRRFLLADGKKWRLDKPKVKNQRHVVFLDHPKAWLPEEELTDSLIRARLHEVDPLY